MSVRGSTSFQEPVFQSDTTYRCSIPSVCLFASMKSPFDKEVRAKSPAKFSECHCGVTYQEMFQKQIGLGSPCRTNHYPIVVQLRTPAMP